MSSFDSLGLRGGGWMPPGETPIEQVIVQCPLHRILAFVRRSIDDVVNSPVAKNQVYGYYKLSRFIERRGEILELEQQWNPLGRSA
jgi:hypothetical protein